MLPEMGSIARGSDGYSQSLDDIRTYYDLNFGHSLDILRSVVKFGQTCDR